MILPRKAQGVPSNFSLIYRTDMIPERRTGRPDYPPNRVADTVTGPILVGMRT